MISKLNKKHALFTYVYMVDPDAIVRQYKAVDDASRDVKAKELEPEQIVLATANDIQVQNTPVVTHSDDGKKLGVSYTPELQFDKNVLPIYSNSNVAMNWCRDNGYCITLDCNELPINNVPLAETNHELDFSKIGQDNEIVVLT